MARRSVGLTFSTLSASHLPEATQTVASTTVAANIATLVADGAAPTQAHVTTLNTNWAALLAGLPGIPAKVDVVLSFDATVVGTRSNLRRAIEALLAVVDSGNSLTG